MAKGERSEERFDEFCSVGELAKVLQLTPVTIYRMIDRGELPCYTFGRLKRFRTRDIQDYFKRCRTPVSAIQGRRQPSP
jgi:excisionase family DNA binding protein